MVTFFEAIDDALLYYLHASLLAHRTSECPQHGHENRNTHPSSLHQKSFLCIQELNKSNTITPSILHIIHHKHKFIYEPDTIKLHTLQSSTAPTNKNPHPIPTIKPLRQSRKGGFLQESPKPKPTPQSSPPADPLSPK